MNLYKPSTEIQPLLFFKTFLHKEIIAAYEKQFYEQSINPSQQNNINQGYIEYNKDYYENGEAPSARIYFANKLQSLLSMQIDITMNFLTERKLQKEFDEVFENTFVNRKLDEIEVIKKKSETLPHQDKILKSLQDLLDKMKGLLYPEKEKVSAQPYKASKNIYNPFFGNKKTASDRHLKKLYKELINFNFIDDIEVTEETFVQVFTVPKPQILENKIKFNVDNNNAMYFLNKFSVHFDNLKPAKIAKSGAFVSKQNNVFTEEIINTTNFRLKKKNESQFESIKKAIENSMPPVK